MPRKTSVNGGPDSLPAVKDEDDKASLVASFFGPAVGGKQSGPPGKPQPRNIPERASFEPEGESVSEDEDDEIEKLIKAAEAELQEKSGPPVPARYVINRLCLFSVPSFDCISV